MRFKSLPSAIEMYRTYAVMAGFDVRLYTQRKVGDYIKYKYVVYNRNGKPTIKYLDGKNKKNSKYKATGCQANIIFHPVKGTTDFMIYKFVELHNHEFLDPYHLRISRKIYYSNKELIIRASTVKIGATKAYKLKASFKGGFEHVKGKVTDYKILKRDVGGIISYKDAQLIVNKMIERKDHYPNYSFYYKCDENKILKSMFRADDTDKAYYNEFGDVISFDAVFHTNK